jgi:hypothetical protein
MKNHTAKQMLAFASRNRRHFAGVVTTTLCGYRNAHNRVTVTADPSIPVCEHCVNLTTAIAR